MATEQNTLGVAMLSLAGSTSSSHGVTMRRIVAGGQHRCGSAPQVAPLPGRRSCNLSSSRQCGLGALLVLPCFAAVLSRRLSAPRADSHLSREVLRCQWGSRRRNANPALLFARFSRVRASKIAASSSTSMQAEGAPPVICFDFDGVIGDSVDESSTAAWLHARQLWPDLDLGASPDPFLPWMRQVRPVVETGWENTVLVRLLATHTGDDAELAESVLSGWDALRDAIVEEQKLDRDTMIREYGEVRDTWIADDRAAWLKRTRPYDNVPKALLAMIDHGTEVFVITTKQRRFCAALLEDFGVRLPEGRLFGLEDGPKTGVLRGIIADPQFKGRRIHFIEDKLSTLEKVAADPELEAVQLHFVDWGYNTAAQRERVARGELPGISMLTKDDLSNESYWA